MLDFVDDVVFDLCGIKKLTNIVSIIFFPPVLVYPLQQYSLQLNYSLIKNILLDYLVQLNNFFRSFISVIFHDNFSKLPRIQKFLLSQIFLQEFLNLHFWISFLTHCLPLPTFLNLCLFHNVNSSSKEIKLQYFSFYYSTNL